MMTPCERPVSERRRFDFVRGRDGLAAALDFERRLVRIYRRAALHPTQYGIYKRRLATAYCEAKRILSEHGVRL